MGVFDVYNSSADAYFSALPDAEPAPVKAIVNAFIVGLKADGLWSNIDGGNILCLGTAGNGLVDFRNPSRVATRAGSPTHTFTAYRGFAGSGAAAVNQTDYIDTGFVPSSAGGAFTQNSAHLGIYSRSAGQATPYDAGALGTNGFYFRTRSTGDAFTGNSNRNTLTTFSGSVADGSGSFIMSRTAAMVTSAYRNGALVGTISSASIAAPDASIRYLQVQTLAATTRQISFGCYGAGLNAQEAAKLDARVQALIGALTVM